MDLMQNTKIDYTETGNDRRTVYRSRWTIDQFPSPPDVAQNSAIAPNDPELPSAWHVGDWAEVRPLSEILATLDDHSARDHMPFMPEMVPHCGRRYRVVKVAHKTCDAAGWQHVRSMRDLVHLETRCDGSCHGGCQAECLFFWNTAWLRKVDGPQIDHAPTANAAIKASPLALAALDESIHVQGVGVRYRCQATEIKRAGKTITPFNLVQYVRDLRSGNVALRDFFYYLALALMKTAKVWLMATLRFLRHLGKRGPQSDMPKSYAGEPLNLQPGDLVRIKSRAEIMQTLNAERKNFGLSFDSDMMSYCGSTREVIRKVERIIDDRTGKMLHFSRSSYILNDVVCRGLDCRSRLFCPRAVYTFWRDAWLERLPPNS
jgi:hypothetical protein